MRPSTTVRTLAVRATELDGDEHEAAFARFAAQAPAFPTYQRRADRRLPVMRLSPLPAPEEV